MEANFKKCVETVRSGKLRGEKPSREDMLKIYGLYKQSTQGNVRGECPSRIRMEAFAKWNAWKQYKGMSQPDAKNMYQKIVSKWWVV